MAVVSESHAEVAQGTPSIEMTTALSTVAKDVPVRVTTVPPARGLRAWFYFVGLPLRTNAR